MIFSGFRVYPQVFGKYVLEKELSRGGMARVVLATLRGAGGFEKRLVVKQIRDELAFDQQFVRRFVEEAKTTVALSHPNIVPVYELGVEEGTYFLAMELVEGVSVSDLLADGGVLTPEEGAYVGVEVCRALAYAHRRMNVVHRDITPRNVMIDEEGQVKLIDFGIAAPALVAGQEILGSPGHMAPEQLDGGELGPPTDIFALAVLLTEAWTGRPPFRRATPEECAAALRTAERVGLAASDARLEPLDEPIARAMNRDAAARQQEANELGRDLRGFLQNTDIELVARKLGDRVRALRAEEHDAPPESLREPRPITATQNTQTFAANEAALSFTPSTRKLPDGIAEGANGPSTRKLPDDAAEATNATAPARPPKSGGGSAVGDSIATRPISTPMDAIAPSAARRGWNGYALVVALGALAALGFYKSRGTTSAADPPPPAPSPVVTASAVARASSAPVVVPSAASVASTSPAPPAPAAPPAPSVVAPLTAKASVSLVGEPGTRVSVDGMARGPCPTRVALEPGRHDVRFTFDPTSESRGEALTVKSGESVTVRAEFTGATPTIRVQR